MIIKSIFLNNLLIKKKSFKKKFKFNKLKTLKDVPNKTTANIKQALFVGSSAELHKMLKNKNKNGLAKEDKDFKKTDWQDEVKYD